MHIDVLVADGATTRVGAAVMKALRKRGLSCEGIDDREVQRDEYGYLRLLKATLQEVRPKVLIPIFKSEIVARNLSVLPEGVGVPVGDAGTIRLLDSKVDASVLCSRLGIPQPRLYHDDEIGSIADFPKVVKLDSGLGGSGVYFPKDSKALANIVRSAGARSRHLVMDYIEGYDISVDAIRWGDYFQAAAYRTLYPRQKGTSLVRLGVRRPELIEYVRTILDEVDYRGACGVDFRIESKSGKAYFLECNPRLSGGLKSSLAAGFDMPFVLWQLCRGEVPEIEKIRTGRLSVERELLYL